MQTKLLQILLGAVGSAVTVLISYYIGAPQDVAVGAAMGVGSFSAVAASAARALPV